MIHYIVVSVLVIISTIVLRTGLHNIDLLPAQASMQAKTVDWLFGIHIDLIAFIFSLIVVFILYSIVVFRRRRGDDSDGAYIEGNPVLEIVWTIIPLGIVLYLAFVGAQALADLERRDPDAMKVDVIASQWNWRFEYPAYGISSPDLVLPLNKQTLLRLQSTDVIHSFWVPEFRVKQDALPGGKEFIRDLRINPNQLGSYTVRCAELCGTEHHSMAANVEVINQSDFEAWLEETQAECDLGQVGCGERWVKNYGCLSCHTVDGTEGVGPTWAGLFQTMAPMSDGSEIMVDEDYLRESIMYPHMKVREGFSPNVMPENFVEMMLDEELDDIIAFIKSLE
jgi:cytochrome c oxidase subunit 2